MELAALRGGERRAHPGGARPEPRAYQGRVRQGRGGGENLHSTHVQSTNPAHVPCPYEHSRKSCSDLGSSACSQASITCTPPTLNRNTEPTCPYEHSGKPCSDLGSSACSDRPCFQAKRAEELILDVVNRPDERSGGAPATGGFKKHTMAAGGCEAGAYPRPLLSST
jgi:hypothetical protein